jgi:hypothetical protein
MHQIVTSLAVRSFRTARLSIPQGLLVDGKLRLGLGRVPERPIATVQQEMRAGVLWSL